MFDRQREQCRKESRMHDGYGEYKNHSRDPSQKSQLHPRLVNARNFVVELPNETIWTGTPFLSDRNEDAES